MNIKKGSFIVMVYILHWYWLYSGDNFPSAVMQPVYTEAWRCERNFLFFFSSNPFSKSDLNHLLSCVYDISFHLWKYLKCKRKCQEKCVFVFLWNWVKLFFVSKGLFFFLATVCLSHTHTDHERLKCTTTHGLNSKSIHVLPVEFWYLAALSKQDASIMC